MRHYTSSALAMAALFAGLALYMLFLLLQGLYLGKMMFSWNDVIDLVTFGFFRDRDGRVRIVDAVEVSMDKDPLMYWMAVAGCLAWIGLCLFGIVSVLAANKP